MGLFLTSLFEVGRAKRMEHVKIVSYDWLEDSLQSKNRRPKGERIYLWANILKKTENETVAEGTSRKNESDLKISKAKSRMW